MNAAQIASTVGQTWDASIVPTLEKYIRIPNQSPLFDPDWKRKVLKSLREEQAA